MLAKAYHELKDRQQKEINEFPMAYAFNNKQLEEALVKLGNVDISECCTYLGIGDVLLKKDVPALKEMMKRHNEECREFLKGDENDIYEAFLYEMDNHEYAINYEGDENVLSCFAIDAAMLKEYGLQLVYDKARREHMRKAHEEWELI